MAGLSAGESLGGSGKPKHGVPSDYRVRLIVYLALQAAVFLAPGPGILLPAAAIAILGARAGVKWRRWLVRLRALLGIVLLPALAGLPEAWAARTRGASAFILAWEPGLRRSLAFLVVLASAEWLSRTTRVDEIREALEVLLEPFGSRGRRAALAASLTLGFLPWAHLEISRSDEAARLRGSDPRKEPLRHLSGLGVPLTVRLLEKARLSSEALALREADPDGMAAARRDGLLDYAADLGGQGGHQDTA